VTVRTQPGRARDDGATFMNDMIGKLLDWLRKLSGGMVPEPQGA